jgi:hypothetical protein
MIIVQQFKEKLKTLSKYSDKPEKEVSKYTPEEEEKLKKMRRISGSVTLSPKKHKNKE